MKIWEASVRATHHFLSDAEINEIKHYVLQAMEAVEHLLVVEQESGKKIGFMGIQGAAAGNAVPFARGKG